MGFFEELLDEKNQGKFTDQGSEEWEQIRAGRFTSSEIHKIMDCGKRPMTPEELAARPKKGVGSKTTQVPDPSKMSKDGMTYIMQKVSEVLTGRPKPGAYAYPLVYGKETEPEAVEFFENKFGVTCETVGFQEWGEHAGGSPDRLIGDHEGLEIKCPYQSEHQVGYLMLTDFFDLKRMHPDYYWQCVSLMMFTGRKMWHFCTYDPRMIKDEHKLTHIRIPADSEMVSDDMELINTAIAGAVKEKLAILKLLNP